MDNESIPTPKTVELNSVQKMQFENFVQTYFDTNYQLFVEGKAEESKKLTSSLQSYFSNKELAKQIIEDIENRKLTQSYADFSYQLPVVEVKVDEKTLSFIDGNVKAQVDVHVILPTNAKDAETGKYITTNLYNTYSFEAHQLGNDFFIIKQEDVNNANTNSFFEKEENIGTSEATNKTTAYTFSGAAAANFALAHYNNVSNISNYTNYTNSGGDCTNFLSRCLREGGWAQTNNWFFVSNGTSGNNMSQYSRSPSWTGANNFYQYITNSGMYAGINGNNRVTAKFSALAEPSSTSSSSTWTTFYNKVKVLQKGDIIQIGNGATPATIGHSMIVTAVSTSSPYVWVSYRNATGYSVAGNLSINSISGGTKLYGFNVKTSGY